MTPEAGAVIGAGEGLLTTCITLAVTALYVVRLVGVKTTESVVLPGTNIFPADGV